MEILTRHLDFGDTIPLAEHALQRAKVVPILGPILLSIFDLLLSLFSRIIQLYILDHLVCIELIVKVILRSHGSIMLFSKVDYRAGRLSPLVDRLVVE